MRAIGLLTALVVGVLAAPGSFRAEQPVTGTAPDEPVPLYTNADLAKFGPPGGTDQPVRVQDEGKWEFVQAFLDREYARVDAEREHDLRRAAAEGRLRQVAPTCARYVAPFLGVYGFPGVMPFRYPRTGAWPPYAALGQRGGRPPDRGLGARSRPSGQPGPARHDAAPPRPSGS
jgi:hypothetical protein